MASGQQFMIVVLFLLALVSIGSCLQCFQCSDLIAPDRNCGDLSRGPIPKITCAPSQVCGKIVLPELHGFPENTNRACVKRDYCEGTKGSVVHCSTCTEDLCNSAFTVAPSFIITFALFVVKHYFL